jgi:hypothetical protein
MPSCLLRGLWNVKGFFFDPFIGGGDVRSWWEPSVDAEVMALLPAWANGDGSLSWLATEEYFCILFILLHSN